MRSYLLDTNAWIRLATNVSKVPQKVLRILKDPRTDVFVSHVSMWEIAVKRSIGKLALTTGESTEDYMSRICIQSGTRFIPIETQDISALEALPLHHSDPFDRLIIAQAKRRELAIVTSDAMFDSYDVKVIW